VFFDLSGNELWFSGFSKGGTLKRLELASGRIRDVAIPFLMTGDGILYVAQNPARPGEYAVATFARSVYVTKDGGASWKQIADRGREH